MFNKKLTQILLICTAFIAVPGFGGSLDIWWSNEPLNNGSIHDALKPTGAKSDTLLQTPQNYLSFATLMIRNTGKKLLTVKPRLFNKSLQNNIILHEAVSIRSRGMFLFSDILPELPSNAVLLIPAGETRQLFFEINTQNLKPGIYKEKVDLLNLNNSSIASAVLKVDVTKMKLPQKPTMNLMVWDCSLRQLKNKEFAQRLADSLGKAGINVYHVLNTIDIKFNKKGEIVGTPDFSELDFVLDKIKPYKGLALLRGCRVFVQRGGPRNKSNQRHNDLRPLKAVDGNIKYYSPEWHNALRNYIKVLSKHMAEKGWSKKEWAFYPYDEYIGVYFSDFAKASKKIDSEVMIYANWAEAGSEEALRDKIKNEIDIHTAFDQDYYNNQKKKLYDELKPYLKKRWTYFCPWGQLGMSPTKRYRLMGWNTFAWGIDGAGYWSATGYNGSRWGGDPWDDTDGIYANVTTLYITHDDIIESRRWMGVKSASRDHALFVTARKLANKWPDSNPKKKQLLKLLNEDIPKEITRTRPDVMQGYLKQVINLSSKGN